MFSKDLIQQAAILAAQYSLPLDMSLAIIEAESNGTPFAKVSFIDWNGKQFDGELPLIRYEGLYARRILTQKSAKLLAQAEKEGLSGAYQAVKNPSSQSERYKMLVRMWKIDQETAIRCCSYGLGQVMGDHALKLKYSSYREFFDAMMTGGVRAQLDVMFRYFTNFGMTAAIKAKDPAKCAELYNGSSYKDNGYDTTIARNLKRWQAYIITEGGEEAIRNGKTVTAQTQQVAPASPGDSIVLHMGDSSQAVKTVQKNLVMYAIDGVSTAKTSDEVKKFQVIIDLLTLDDGKYGPNTNNAIKQFQYIIGKPVTGDYTQATADSLDAIVKGWSEGNAKSLDAAAELHFKGNKADRKDEIKANKDVPQPEVPAPPIPITTPATPVDTTPVPDKPVVVAPDSGVTIPTSPPPAADREPQPADPAKGKATGPIAVIAVIGGAAYIFWHHITDAVVSGYHYVLNLF